MRLAELLTLLDSWYDPAWAEPWDRVGLVCGDPEDDVRRVLLAVDPVEVVVDEALAFGADLLLVHHPLLLTPTSSVAATSPKGRVVHRLTRAGCALLTAHTNADVPAGGVNEAMAAALGLEGARVLEPTDDPGLDQLVTFVPVVEAERVRRALARAGAGAVGDYDSCSFSTPGEGRFRPLEGADPAIGSVGSLEKVAEVRVETVLPRERRAEVVAALREAHPYEEPAFSVVALREAAGSVASTRGHGRVGTLPAAESLRGFADRVAAAFPATAHGVRVAGDPERRVRTVAVLAGSGESLLEAAQRAGADVVVTSDLKHHRASELLEEPGAPALVDVAHWAAEWSWLPVAADRIRAALAERAGDTVEPVDVRVSTTVTDPWTFRA